MEENVIQLYLGLSVELQQSSSNWISI